MFKRLFWLVVGAAFGFGLAFWLMRAVRETAARLTPSGIATEVLEVLRQLGRDLREVAAEGRAGMRETEERLRAELRTPVSGKAR